MPTPSFPVTLRDLYLLRHGETEGESSIRYHGVNDVPLSAFGRDQMRRVAASLASVEIAAVVSSPLDRARESARLAVAGRDLAPRIEPAFREIDFGRWEGLTRDEIRLRDPELYAEWIREPSAFGFPEGETREAFERRVAAGVERLLALPVPCALVVVHKGVIRSIVRRLCHQTLAAEAPALAEVLHLSAQGSGWSFAPAP